MQALEERDGVGLGQARHPRLGRQGAAVVGHADEGDVGRRGRVARAVRGEEETQGQAQQQAWHDGSSVYVTDAAPESGPPLTCLILIIGGTG